LRLFHHVPNQPPRKKTRVGKRIVRSVTNETGTRADVKNCAQKINRFPSIDPGHLENVDPWDDPRVAPILLLKWVSPTPESGLIYIHIPYIYELPCNGLLLLLIWNGVFKF
jgi:hypothetical protein